MGVGHPDLWAGIVGFHRDRRPQRRTRAVRYAVGWSGTAGRVASVECTRCSSGTRSRASADAKSAGADTHSESGTRADPDTQSNSYAADTRADSGTRAAAATVYFG